MEAAVTGSCVLLKKEELGMASLSPTSTRLLAAVKRDGGSHHVIVPIEAAYALLRDEPGSLKLRDASKRRLLILRLSGQKTFWKGQKSVNVRLEREETREKTRLCSYRELQYSRMRPPWGGQ
mmetsp:Transcript_28500/g.55812  ORF Transcript_28500/g.55812 Transcript_28500/m.55812 type:complete len:122 (-) Transcript_28500:639-1004(-)